jgi:hypothetical protein
MAEPVTAALAALGGFLAKSLWDIYWTRRHEAESVARKLRIDFLERRQLKEFYWPLCVHFQKNDAVWEFLKRAYYSDDALENRVSTELMKVFFLPNHEEISRIIEANVYLAQADEMFMQLIRKFLRHVAIYKAMRSSDLDLDPIAVGEPWPEGLSEAVAKRTAELQSKFDREVGIDRELRLPNPSFAAKLAIL